MQAKSVWQNLQYLWPDQHQQRSFEEWLSWILDNNHCNKHSEILVAQLGIGEFTMEGLQQPKNLNSEIWEPPPPDIVKVNYDACFNQQERKGWSGLIIRNHEGYELGACRRKLSRVHSPFVAEEVAVEHALEFAKDLGFIRIIVEGDSRKVAEKFVYTQQDFSVISAYIWTSRQRAKGFPTCEFRWIPREKQGRISSGGETESRGGRR
ncbi:hypothetical protein F3Y22_tig00111641pilonHSYRG00034 [Hibiscus syriacus]|uniref:RNase H type-1 domain-containing protein n=1 Tax=Hibiscus syriacus TaxID=106335 RepID=A0A6A2XI51_HIBSY|nr:hypothetical protein F3Y22_tig00111641pilonHSYRG00034 [Hibiscus syriacus]